jgi:lipoprotein-releasing system ATP-binding protein
MSEGSGFMVHGSGLASGGREPPEPAAVRVTSVPTIQHSVLSTPTPSTSVSPPHSALRTPHSALAAAAPSRRTPLLAARGLEKSYRKGQVVIPVLKGVDFAVREGEFVAVVGQSGCGKSTLLHLLGTLDGPDAGEIYFDGNRIDNLPSRSRDVLRNEYFGMIFQFYHLLPELSTLENVLAPIMIRYGAISYWRQQREHAERAKALLEMVGLSHRLTHKPRELSGGEMQRAAIARALIADPQLLLADEPTGNLDQKTGGEILALLKKLNRQHGLTIIMVTHDAAIARQADRTVRLVEGKVAA